MLEINTNRQVLRPVNWSNPAKAIEQSGDHWRAQARMTEDEFDLWENRDSMRKHLILMYLPLVDVLAKRIARSAGCNWEDLRQDGAIGLIKAVERFDHTQGVPFKAFARNYIRGAIFDGTELTRDMARRQEQTYRKVRKVETDLTKVLGRNPTIEEVAEEAQVTTNQILNAIDAHGVAFAGEFPDSETLSTSVAVVVPETERNILLLQAAATLNAREQEIIRLYYWEDRSHEEIGQALGLTVSNVTKIRQRAINKLRKVLDVN